MNPETINVAAQGIRDVLRESPGGYPNEGARQKLCTLARRALYAADHAAYVSEKATSIESLATILYSHRKFKSYDMPGQDGATRVRQMILSDANNLEQWVPPPPSNSDVRHGTEAG